MTKNIILPSNLQVNKKENVNQQSTNLIDNQILFKEENEYINLKKKIMSDNTIDNQMKSILLQSKKEYLDNLKKKINSQNDSNIKQDLNGLNLSPELNDLLREFNKKCLKSNNYKNHKDLLLKKIINYNEKKIDVIYLEFEMCWDIYKIINNKIFDLNKKKKLFELFKPSNEEEYNNYVKIIEISKREHEKKLKKEKEENLKIKEKEKMIKINEEKKKIEIINRKKVISILQNHFNKLSFCDDEIKQIQNESNDSIIKYLNLETEFIQLDNQLHSRFNKFIDSVRISPEEKKYLLMSINVIE